VLLYIFLYFLPRDAIMHNRRLCRHAVSVCPSVNVRAFCQND